MGSSTTRALRLQALCPRTLPAARPGVELRSRGSSGLNQTLNLQADIEAGKTKSIDDLPGPSLATTLYWLFIRGYADKSHLLQDVQKNLFGPIWRSRFGPFDIVNVASPELIAEVIRQEGKFPLRCDLPHWKEYRDLRGQAYGLHMLKLHEVSAYAPIIHQVVGDLLRRVEVLRRKSEDGNTEEIPPDTLRFIAAANDMLTLSETVVLFPRWSRGVLPFWGRFVQAWDDLYDVARTLIDRRICEIEAQVSSGEPAEGLYLTYLLTSDQLSRSEVYTSVTELLLGGSTRDGGAQERLHREVVSVCPDLQEPNSDDLSRMPFLKAVIKETLRLYPVVPGNGRFVSEEEVVVGNYWFPKKTQFHLCHYSLCHDEDQFEDAELFKPERWLRGDSSRSKSRTESYTHHPYSFIPFGVGVRGCVGKRVAEMEMFFALSRVGGKTWKEKREVNKEAMKERKNEK
ncbi:hypothetical protein F7725_008922, partial [Dissostichus mawsoni]